MTGTRVTFLGGEDGDTAAFGGTDSGNRGGSETGGGSSDWRGDRDW